MVSGRPCGEAETRRVVVRTGASRSFLLWSRPTRGPLSPQTPMNRPHVALALVLLTALAACGVTAPETVRLRVANASEWDFEQVLVDFPGESLDYGSVPAGGASEYRVVGKAYPYARIEIRGGATPMVLQPIDFVGVSPLSPGSYTYRIDVDTLRNGLTLQLVEDD